MGLTAETVRIQLSPLCIVAGEKLPPHELHNPDIHRSMRSKMDLPDVYVYAPPSNTKQPQ